MKRRTLRRIGLVVSGGLLLQLVGCTSFLGQTLLQTVVNAVVGTLISTLIANATTATG